MKIDFSLKKLQVFVWLKRIFLAIVILFAARFFFWIYNYEAFIFSNIYEFANTFFWGSFFDLISLFYFFIPFTLFSFLPLKLFYSIYYQKFLKTYFVIILGFLFSITIIDAAYFPFSKNRLGFEAFKMAASEEISLIKYITSYWYFLPLIALIFYISAKFFTFIKNAEATKWYINLIVNIIVLCLFAIAIRGGFRLKPLRSIDTAIFVSPQYAQLAQSTGFHLIESFSSETLEMCNYFSPAELDNIMKNDYIDFSKNENPRKNILIIILESFGQEYTFPKKNSAISYSPFLNELALKSEFYSNAYSNGTRSVDAIPAILEGVPKLTKTDFMYSNYISNKTPGFAFYLNEKGYDCRFYHGGINGTLGFEAFLASRGWKYFGKNQYTGNKNDYDGNWGIYDGPYLKYLKNQISEIVKPFVTVVFTLSSHHPYKLPPDYKDSFKTIKKPIHKTIRYVDNCLRDFFKSIENEKWYKNTVFVITADHSAENFTKLYNSNNGKYAVPMLVYNPDKLERDTVNKVIQHIDILPLALKKAGFEGKIFSIGNFYKYKMPKMSFHNEDGIYTAFTDSVFMTFDGKNFKFNNIYNNNIPPIKKQKELEHNLKAVIQNYNYRMIKNKFY
ncbi:MAG: sulfatase-like hydrolase/transferase [Bacteroidetes bacterium]|nr:sulfatase-like hydrolase/transferase [Bacteroidota bacterium]